MKRPAPAPRRRLPRRVAIAVVLLLCAAIGWALFFRGDFFGGDDTSQPLVIGVLANLTGALASIDRPTVNGIELKIAEINAGGGVLGRKLVLHIEDTRSDLKLVTGVGRKMIEQDKPLAFIAYNDTEFAQALGKIAEQAGVPFLTPGSTSPKLPRQVGREMFLVCFGDNAQAAASAGLLWARLKAGTVFLMWNTDNEYTRLLSGYFKTAYEGRGGKIVGQATFKNGDQKFDAQIAAIKALKTPPAALYVAANTPEEAGTVVKALRGAGLQMPIVGGDAYDAPEFLQTAGAAADDVYYTTHIFFGAPNRPKLNAFIAAYRNKFGKPPENAFAALGYDAAGVLAEAIKRANAPDREKIRLELANNRLYRGITGTIIFHSESRVPEKTVFLVGVHNGRPFLVDTVLPVWVPKP
jgi:branched-chain amino acid transport system substrate-binding protein